MTHSSTAKNVVFLTQIAGSGHRIAVLVMARAGLGAVHSILAKVTGEVTAEKRGKGQQKEAFE